MNAIRKTGGVGIGVLTLMMAGAGVAQSAATPARTLKSRSATRQAGTEKSAVLPVGSAPDAYPVTAAKPESLAVGNKMYDAEKELARLTKRYSLTADQKTKIQPILLEQQQQVHALGEDDALSDTEWAGAVRKVHTQTVAKVKLELTDAQATKYAKDEAKRAKSNGDSDNGDDGPPDGPPPDGGPGGPGGGGPGGGGGGAGGWWASGRVIIVAC
jgi:hypothetical protein